MVIEIGGIGSKIDGEEQEDRKGKENKKAEQSKGVAMDFQMGR